MARCPTCGADVASIFDHVDLACESLPDDLSIDGSGALVVPDNFVSIGLRGDMQILARFDRVVTASGKVVKSRDDEAPAPLKAGRVS